MGDHNENLVSVDEYSNSVSLPFRIGYLSKESIELFKKHGVFNLTELLSRYEILVEVYSKQIHIEMLTMIETMNNYDELAAKAKEKADTIRNALKEEMVRLETEELTVGTYIIRYTNIVSNRFDSTTFKRLYADLYKDFTKPVSSRRFTVSL